MIKIEKYLQIFILVFCWVAIGWYAMAGVPPLGCIIRPGCTCSPTCNCNGIGEPGESQVNCPDCISGGCSGVVPGPIPGPSPITHQPNNDRCILDASGKTNGFCDYEQGETYMDCVSDCGVEGGARCNGNGTCEPYLGESWYINGQECGDCVVKPVCNNNGVCEGNCDVACNKTVPGLLSVENPTNCPKDCGCPLPKTQCNYDGVCDISELAPNRMCSDCREPLYHLVFKFLAPPSAIKFSCDYDGRCEQYNQATGQQPENQFTCADCIYPKYSDGICGKDEKFRQSYDCTIDPCNKDGVCEYYVAKGGSGMAEDLGSVYRQENDNNCFIDCKNLDKIAAIGCSTPSSMGECGDSSHKSTLSIPEFDSNCNNISSFDNKGYTFNGRYYFDGVNSLCYDKKMPVCVGSWQTVTGFPSTCNGSLYYKSVPPTYCQKVDISGYGDTGGNSVCILTERMWPWSRSPATGCNCDGVCDSSKDVGENFLNCPSDCNTCGTDKNKCNQENTDKNFSSTEYKNWMSCQEACALDNDTARKDCEDAANCAREESSGSVKVVGTKEICPPMDATKKAAYDICVASAGKSMSDCMTSCKETYEATAEYLRFDKQSQVCSAYGNGGCDTDMGEDAGNCPQDCGTCGNKICDWASKSATSSFDCQKIPFPPNTSVCKFGDQDLTCNLVPPAGPQSWRCGTTMECDKSYAGCTTTINKEVTGYKCREDLTDVEPKYSCLQNNLAFCPPNNPNCSWASGENQDNCPDDCKCLKNEICDKGETAAKCYDDCHCGDKKCVKNTYQTTTQDVINDHSASGWCEKGWFIHATGDIRPSLELNNGANLNNPLIRNHYYWWTNKSGAESNCQPDNDGNFSTLCQNLLTLDFGSEVGDQCCNDGDSLCARKKMDGTVREFCNFDRICDNPAFSTSSKGINWQATFLQKNYENPFTCPYDCPCYPTGGTWPKTGHGCYSYVYPFWQETKNNCANDCRDPLKILNSTSTNITTDSVELVADIPSLGFASDVQYWFNISKIIENSDGSTSSQLMAPTLKYTTSTIGKVKITVIGLEAKTLYQAYANVENVVDPKNENSNDSTRPLEFRTRPKVCDNIVITKPLSGDKVFPSYQNEMAWTDSAPANCNAFARFAIYDADGRAMIADSGSQWTSTRLGSGFQAILNGAYFSWADPDNQKLYKLYAQNCSSQDLNNADCTSWAEVTVYTPKKPVITNWSVTNPGVCAKDPKITLTWGILGGSPVKKIVVLNKTIDLGGASIHSPYEIVIDYQPSKKASILPKFYGFDDQEIPYVSEKVAAPQIIDVAPHVPPVPRFSITTGSSGTDVLVSFNNESEKGAENIQLTYWYFDTEKNFVNGVLKSFSDSDAWPRVTESCGSSPIDCKQLSIDPLIDPSGADPTNVPIDLTKKIVTIWVDDGTIQCSTSSRGLNASESVKFKNPALQGTE